MAFLPQFCNFYLWTDLLNCLSCLPEKKGTEIPNVLFIFVVQKHCDTYHWVHLFKETQPPEDGCKMVPSIARFLIPCGPVSLRCCEWALCGRCHGASRPLIHYPRALVVLCGVGVRGGDCHQGKVGHIWSHGPCYNGTT